MTWEYRGLQGVAGGYKGLQGLQGVTGGYKGLQRVIDKRLSNYNVLRDFFVVFFYNTKGWINL